MAPTAEDIWALWRADGRATPFQSPAWLEAWWQTLGGGERIDLVARDEQGALIGYLPAHVWHDGPVRRLVPVAAGQSDYSDALIAPGQEAEAVAGLLAAAAQHGERWDELLLPDVRPDSPLLRAAPEGWSAAEGEGEICPVLALPAEGDLLPSLSKSARRKVVHDRHRADAVGGVVTGFAGRDEVDEALDALFALHAARWAREGEAGVLADPRIQAILRAASVALAEAGLLRLAGVRHEGRVVAVLLGLADGRRGYSYINGVDFSVPKQSFGTLAFAALIEDALAGGAGEFHFLRGEEGYKYAWGAQPLRTVRRVMRLAKG